jgi:hypothetical protein
MMKTATAWMAGILLLGLIATPVWAQEEEVDDFTMEVVSDADADEAEYVEEIELPEAASDTARDNAAFGIDTANEARKNASEDGRAFGERTASEARQRGRDADNAAGARDRADDASDRGNRP